MIRLNDINKTVIDESKVVAYYGYEEGDTYCISIDLGSFVYNGYNSEEERDKDIELLDKLFEVKDIKDQVEIVKLQKEVATHDMGIPRDIMDNLNSSEPVEDKYIWWGDVCQVGSLIAKLPNGNRVKCTYNPQANHISFSSPKGDKMDAGYIYSVDLFNALMLKKVE